MTMAWLLAAALAGGTPALRPGLEPLTFLVGHCWRGAFPTGQHDTHCFESVFDGQHVRDRHEVVGGGGTYRGETLFSADASGAVSFTYWNSSGGISRGTMRADADRLDFGDEAYRGPDGREIRIATSWRRIGEDSYESSSVSTDAPSMNRTVRFVRLAGNVSESTLVNPDGSHTLVHEAVVDAAPAAAWDAIATAEGWMTWAVPIAWLDGDLLETSYTSTAARGDRSTIQQSIVARIPGRLIVFRTIKAPDGFPHFETFRAVTHMMEIEPAGDGRTRVRLTSAGYADDDAGRQLLGFFRSGNRTTLEQLRQRFLTGPRDWSRAAQAAANDGD